VPSTKKTWEKAYSGDVHKLVKAEVGESIEAEGPGIGHFTSSIRAIALKEAHSSGHIRFQVPMPT
jgi:hypothetical protein